MEIKNLKETPLNIIVDCLLDSFSNYFVPMTADLTYWENRFKAARVNYELSYGMFDNGKLVGFIINGIDYLGDSLTAFNTGTGVISGFRGQNVVDRIYEQAIPELKTKGVTKCTLEVIQKNDIAIHVYERIGFSKSRGLNCFKGTISSTVPAVTAERIAFDEIVPVAALNDRYYSWDNVSNAVKAAGDIYQTYTVSDEKGNNIGYFVINPLNGYLAQFEVLNGKPEDWKILFSGISTISQNIRINNVDEQRKELVNTLLSLGLENHIDQYEMEMSLN
jgi:GNAT superfamily N-acetyltransferase